jgi:hypothetical protein
MNGQIQESHKALRQSVLEPNPARHENVGVLNTTQRKSLKTWKKFPHVSSESKEWDLNILPCPKFAAYPVLLTIPTTNLSLPSYLVHCVI